MNIFMDLQAMCEKSLGLELEISELKEANERYIEKIQIQEFETENTVQKLKRKLREYKMNSTLSILPAAHTDRLQNKVQEYKDRLIGYEDRITDLENVSQSKIG